MTQYNVCILVIFVVLVPYIRMNSQFSAIVCMSQNLYYKSYSLCMLVILIIIMVQLISNFKQASEKRQYFPSQKFLNQVKFINH